MPVLFLVLFLSDDAMDAFSILLVGLLAPSAAVLPHAPGGASRPSMIRARSARMAMNAAPTDDSSQRMAVGALAAVGAAETAVITADKLWDSNVLDGLCSAAGGGCTDLLRSQWAAVGDVPLSALGFVAYVAAAALALAPLVARRDADRPDSDVRGAERVPMTSDGLLVLTSAMAGFSACLMGLLVYLREVCPLCILSAALSATIFLLTWGLPSSRSRTEDAVLAGCGAAVSAAAAAILFLANGAGLGGGSRFGYSGFGDDGMPPAVESHSTPRALRIGQQLAERDATMFGAWWCSHCAGQKEALGQEVMEKYHFYVECSSDGASRPHGSPSPPALLPLAASLRRSSPPRSPFCGRGVSPLPPTALPRHSPGENRTSIGYRG